MYVRLAFAVAAHLEPEILLVDEVLAVGDAAFQKKCLGKMGDVAKEGRTVLFVSHNMGSIERLCKRALLIDAGTLVFEDVTSNVVSRYLSQDTAEINGFEQTATTFSLFRFVSLKAFRNNEPQPVMQFLTGDRVVFRIEVYCCQDSMELRPSLHCYDLYHNLIFAFNPQERGFKPEYRTGINRLHLTIPVLSLLEGTYSISMVLYLKGHGIVQEISNAAQVTVFASDIFESGYAFGSTHGKVLIEHSWELVD
jgi:lipopolysaccharide transport system ATP-binding protein